MKKGLTIDKALIFSAIMIILFTITMIITYWYWNSVPDALIVAFFAAFSCEGGFCMFIHKLKKDREILQIGDITRLDDAEIAEDTPEQGVMVIDLEEDDGK